MRPKFNFTIEIPTFTNINLLASFNIMKSLNNLLLLLSFFALYLCNINNTVSAQATHQPTTDDVADKAYNQAIKFSPLGPLFGQWNFSYEKASVFGKNSTLEVTAGLNTKPLFMKPTLDEAGLSMIGGRVEFGPRIYFGKQEFSIDGMRRTHLLYGKYFKPELGFSYTNYKYINDSNILEVNHMTTISMLFLLGKQWVSDRFVLDLNGGIGYAYRNTSDRDVNNALENIPVAAKLGFKIGFIY